MQNIHDSLAMRCLLKIKGLNLVSGNSNNENWRRKPINPIPYLYCIWGPLIGLKCICSMLLTRVAYIVLFVCFTFKSILNRWIHKNYIDYCIIRSDFESSDREFGTFSINISLCTPSPVPATERNLVTAHVRFYFKINYFVRK